MSSVEHNSLLWRKILHLNRRRRRFKPVFSRRRHPGTNPHLMIEWPGILCLLPTINSLIHTLNSMIAGWGQTLIKLKVGLHLGHHHRLQDTVSMEVIVTSAPTTATPTTTLVEVFGSPTIPDLAMLIDPMRLPR